MRVAKGDTRSLDKGPCHSYFESFSTFILSGTLSEGRFASACNATCRFKAIYVPVWIVVITRSSMTLFGE